MTDSVKVDMATGEVLELDGMPDREVLVTFVYRLQDVATFMAYVPGLDSSADIPDGLIGSVTKVVHTRKDGVDIYQVTITEDP